MHYYCEYSLPEKKKIRYNFMLFIPADVYKFVPMLYEANVRKEYSACVIPASL